VSHPVRIALAGPDDPRDPSTFSGSARHLLDALTQLGTDVVPLSGALGGGLEAHLVRAAALTRLRPGDLRHPRAAAGRELNGARLGWPVQQVRELTLEIARRRSPRVDGLILLGTAARPPRGIPYVTYEDTTITQARRAYDWFWLEGTRPSDHRRHDRRAAEIYRGARACCTLSHWAASSLIEDFAIEPARVHVAGVGPGYQISPPPKRDWTVPRLLFVGFDWPRKNGPRVLRAFARYRGDLPEATLDLVGGHPPIDLAGVTGHGSLPLGSPASARKLASLYARATCFVLPSLHEPSALAYLEAATVGVPSIGTSSGGAATIIGDGGVLVDPHSEDEILRAMRQIGCGTEAQAAGARAARHAESLTWRLVAQRLLKALAPAGLDTGDLPDFL
jgi:glycosyltransferase involved in cell wall biosynthesis